MAEGQQRSPSAELSTHGVDESSAVACLLPAHCILTSCLKAPAELSAEHQNISHDAHPPQRAASLDIGQARGTKHREKATDLGSFLFQALLNFIQHRKSRKESSLEKRAWTHKGKRRPDSRGQLQGIQQGQLWRSSCSCWVEINCSR